MRELKQNNVNNNNINYNNLNNKTKDNNASNFNENNERYQSNPKLDFMKYNLKRNENAHDNALILSGTGSGSTPKNNTLKRINLNSKTNFEKGKYQ